LKDDRSILQDIRLAVGLSEDSVDFDTDLVMNINAALAALYQNGAILPVVVVDDTTTWGELKDPLKVEGNKLAHIIPLYVTLSTKVIFDPPPPSAVEYFNNTVDQLLWRIKTAYEDYTTTTTTVPY
jgi:hypothetical protein